MANLKTMKTKALKNPAVRSEYDRLATEFDLADLLVTLRTRAGLTQEDLAKGLETDKSGISAIERGRGSWRMMQNYAGACGYRLMIDAIDLTATRASETGR